MIAQTDCDDTAGGNTFHSDRLVSTLESDVRTLLVAGDHGVDLAGQDVAVVRPVVPARLVAAAGALAERDDLAIEDHAREAPSMCVIRQTLEAV